MSYYNRQRPHSYNAGLPPELAEKRLNKLSGISWPLQPFEFAALLKLSGVAPSRPLANSALRTSDIASNFSPTALRYSPPQMGGLVCADLQLYAL